MTMHAPTIRSQQRMFSRESSMMHCVAIARTSRHHSSTLCCPCHLHMRRPSAIDNQSRHLPGVTVDRTYPQYRIRLSRTTPEPVRCCRLIHYRKKWHRGHWTIGQRVPS